MTLNAPSEDIGDYLASISSLALAIKTDLFIAEMPDSPDQCVTVYDSGGFDPLIATYGRPTVQVRVRGTKNGYRAAYDLLKKISDELDFLVTTINTTRYLGVWAMGDILSLGKDKLQRPLLTRNFRIHRAG